VEELKEAAVDHIASTVHNREKHIGGSGGSLEPPGPLFEPPGLFLRTSIPFIWCIMSAFLPT
jgi:hypothetical protein